MKQIPNGAAPDISIAEYVCGLLKPEEHAQIHVRLSRDDSALAQALAWEQDLLALVDALPRAHPPAALRHRLQRTLGIDPPPALQPPRTPQLLRQPSREPGSLPAAVLPEPSVIEPETPPPPPAPIDTGSVQHEENLETPSNAPYAHWNHQAAGLLSETRAETDNAAPVGKREPPVPTAAATANSLASTRVAASEPQESRVAPETPLPAPEPKPAGTRAFDTPPPPPAQRAAHTPAEQDDGAMRRLQRSVWLWRLIAVCATGAAIAGFMRPSEPPLPPVQIVKVAPTRAAILQAPGDTSTPGWTATLGPEGNLMMQPLVHTEVPTGSQVLLWTRSERIPEPRLLGSINPNQPVQVPAAQLGALADDQLLEITLETDEDAARGVPHGPILFIGQMAVFGTEGAAAPAANDSAATQGSISP